MSISFMKQRTLTEVKSLVAAHEQPGSFLDEPALNLAADSGARPADSLIGESLGRYRILELLGRGGMGAVYKAKDTMLGREVAIKVLHPAFSINQDRLHRFEQEARAASALNHPNIITIHEFGQEGGVHFIVSELIEGETLRRRMARERMNSDAVLDVSIQIASALNAAHEAGIVHRDIKPENVMVRRDGLVKVLDFGLAKLGDRPASVAFDTNAPTSPGFKTEPGTILGTMAYMSPEQARGLAVDARSDLFSLGVAMYEMAAGRSPFARETVADVIVSILEKEPPPLAEFAPEVPPALETIIGKSLRKDREERYRTAGELLADLKSVKSGAAVAPVAKKETSAGPLKRHWRGAAMAMAALMAIVVGAVYFGRSDRAIESIAVLPFVNADGNPETEYLAEGITESVINSLTQLSNLEVRPRNSVVRYKKRDIDPQVAGRELKVEAVLTGQVTPRGDEITISLQLIDAHENRLLWGTRYQRRLVDLLTLQAEIAREVSENLRLRLSSADRRQMAKRYTDNIEAYRAYLRGRYFWNRRSREGFEKAIQYFDRAIAIDPNYALAYAGLADCHLSRAAYGLSPPAESFPRAKAAAQRALAIDGTLAEAHTSLANIAWLHEWNRDEAERGFKRAIQLNPNYPTAHHWYAVYLSSLARHEEALAEIGRAQALDPLSVIIELDLARIFYFARRYDQAIEQSLKVIEMDPDFRTFNHWLRLAYEQRGLHDKAFEETLKIQARRGAQPETMAAFEAAYAASGWKGYWRKQREMVEMAEKEGGKTLLSPLFIAGIYARLGDHDESLKWLQKAYNRRADHLLSLKVDPVFDGLRSDPRFTKLLRDIGLSP